MAIRLDDGTTVRDISRIYSDDGHTANQIQRVRYDDGVNPSRRLFEAAGAAYPEVTSLTATPPHAALGAAVAGAFELDATATPQGVTLAATRGDGRNIPASGAGNFLLPSVPIADELFTVTATNSLGETDVAHLQWYRTVEPSWSDWRWRRTFAGQSGGEYVSLYTLTATITCWPKPVVTLTGDSYFQSRSLLGGIDLNSSRHLTRGTGARDWHLSITQIRIGYTGSAIHQTMTIRAANALTGGHADRSEVINIGGSQ